MAAIHYILSIEAQNSDKIHLFREGLFFKAYGRSAFLFHTQVKPFKIVRKHYKVVGSDVLLLGFPSGQLDALFPQGGVETLGEGHVAVNARQPFDPDAYYDWCDEVEMGVAPAVSTMPAAVSVHSCLPAALEAKIRAFPIERSSPIDCMMFLSALQKELRGQ
jgi:hypothetical protein